MKKLILIIMAAVSLVMQPLSSRASKHQLIDTNRIWEYYIGGGLAPHCYTFKVRFDGTKVINGKTYNILKTIDCVEVGMNGEPMGRLPGIKTEFYVREENGRIYACNFLNGAPEFTFYGFDLFDYILGIDEEFLIYDFTELEDGYITFRSLFEEQPLRCRAVVEDTYIIDGEACDHYTLYLPEDMESPYINITSDSFIEGIGRHMGFLIYLSEVRFARNPMFDRPDDVPFYSNNRVILEKVTDLKGNVIFDSTQVGVKSMSEDRRSYENMLKIADDRISSSGPSDGFLRIADISGRMVMSTEIEHASEVSISDLPRGVYVATLTTTNGSSSLKFMR